jgi:hypothetical protein
MIRSILTAALLAPALLMSAPLAPAAAQPSIVGTYHGTVGTGAGEVPIETVFTEKAGVLAGSYTVEDPSGAFKGTLDEIDLADNGAYTMTWTDRDGSGGVTMVFAPDGSSFTGKWYAAGVPEGFWNGTKAP